MGIGSFAGTASSTVYWPLVTCQLKSLLSLNRIIALQAEQTVWCKKNVVLFLLEQWRIWRN